HESNIEKVIFSPKLTRFVTIFRDSRLNAEVPATTPDQFAKLWDGTNGHLITTLNLHKASITDAVFSPDGQFIITVSKDKSGKVWSSDNGKLLVSLEGHDDAVLSAAFSSDSKRILTFG